MRPTATLAGVPVGGEQPVRLMAVINVSPESFYAGSVRGDAAALRDAAQRAVGEGADFIDVGAMSTAPYLETAVPVDEEVRRMNWALGVIAPAVAVPISADTTRATVAVAALAGGARLINDVSGLRDPAMADIAAQGEGVVLVAAPGSEPRDGRPPASSSAASPESRAPSPVSLVTCALEESLERARRAGIDREAIVLDPGIGFFTRAAVPALQFNCAVLAHLAALEERVGRPLLVGVSRKAFIGRLTGRDDPAARLPGSLAATAVAVANGAAIIRTHDVAPTRDAVRVAEAIRRG